MGLEGRRVARVDAEGVDAQAADVPAAQQPLAGLGAEAGEVQGPGRVGVAVGGGVADLGRQPECMRTAASRGMRPWRRSKARRSSTVATVSGSWAARSAMSMTTAG